MSNISKTLIKARALIADPEKWCQGHYRTDDDRICASQALMTVEKGTVGSMAYYALADAMGIKSLNVSTFNDEHTHAEVIAAFDRAIANA